MFGKWNDSLNKMHKANFTKFVSIKSIFMCPPWLPHFPLILAYSSVHLIFKCSPYIPVWILETERVIGTWPKKTLEGDGNWIQALKTRKEHSLCKTANTGLCEVHLGYCVNCMQNANWNIAVWSKKNKPIIFIWTGLAKLRLNKSSLRQGFYITFYL